MAIRNTVITTLGTTLLLVGAAGCNGGKGEVQNQNQNQTVRPDGTAVQQRTRTRETGSGAVVQETETRERKVVQPAPGTSGTPDATKTDPGK